MIELTLRLVFSLAVVIGLLLLIARFSSRRLRGPSDSLVRVLHRRPISRNNAVCVVAVGSRLLVLGTTEHEVRVLAELDPSELEETTTITALPAPRPARGAHRAGLPATPIALAAREEDRPSPLTGSVLSAATWRQALAVATRRTT
jgi:flagellar protein FliO/FliZ